MRSSFSPDPIIPRESMIPNVTIFLDGLKPESLKHMPFLGSLPYQGRIKTLLGYSIACHASMYTGVFPDRHLLWFVWRDAPSTSPHRWLRFFPISVLLNHMPGKYFLTKTTRLFYHPRGLFGLPYIVHLPMKFWHRLDVAEKKFWSDPEYLDDCPSLFDHLRKAGVDFEIAGMIRGPARTSDVVDSYQLGDLKPWTYLFIGDVDGLSHKFTQDSPEVISELKRFDQIIERKVAELKRKSSDLRILAFSDHGHINVERKVDIYDHFRQQGDDLNRYFHIIDANFLRLWFKNASQERDCRDVLAKLEGGFVLGEEHLKRYHVTMPDNRYGDLIFYMDVPAMFSKTIWGWSRTVQSMHGYAPDHAGMDGFIASNLPFDTAIPKELVDILPSLLSALDLPIPNDLDGKAIWT
jgi:hypothetical protein